MEEDMRALVLAAAIVVIPGASYAQSPRAFVSGAGGFATTPDGTSGALVGEAAVRIASNLYAIGDIGRLRNVQPSDLQPAVDTTTLVLSNTGLSVTGTARVPAWYSTGGLRFQIPTRGRLTPYAFGGLGVARLTPSATFTYASGTIGASTPAVGDDVTSQIVSLGDFTQPAATTALMVSGGGGVQAPVARHLMVDAGYRLARIAANTPFTAQGLTFGLGYRF
jgi:opacity protein-like surface antigen